MAWSAFFRIERLSDKALNNEEVTRDRKGSRPVNCQSVIYNTVLGRLSKTSSWRFNISQWKNLNVIHQQLGTLIPILNALWFFLTTACGQSDNDSGRDQVRMIVAELNEYLWVTLEQHRVTASFFWPQPVDNQTVTDAASDGCSVAEMASSSNRYCPEWDMAGRKTNPS